MPPFGARALEHVHGARPRRPHEQPGAVVRERRSEAVPHGGVRRVERLDFAPVAGAEDAHAPGLALGRGLSHQHFVLADEHGTAESLRGERRGTQQAGQRGEDGEDGQDGQRSDLHDCDHHCGPPVSSDPA